MIMSKVAIIAVIVAKPRPEYAELGKRIRERRKALNLTQQDAADIAGAAHTFVRAAEQGKPTLQFDKLIDLMQALGLEFRLESGPNGLAIEDES